MCFGWDCASLFVLLQPSYFRDWIKGVGKLRLWKLRHYVVSPLSGVDANAEQVRRGMAWVFDSYVNDRSLYTLQENARSDRLGLWADAQPKAAVGVAGGEGRAGVQGTPVAGLH